MINDIFSKSKKQPNEKPKQKILIDHREKNSLVPSFLKKNGLEIEFIHLKLGDYLVNNFLIERKTNLDFICSILDKRIETQIERLKKQENKLLIIENSVRTKTNFNQNAVKGKILSLALKHKIPIIFTKNEEDTAIYLKILSNKKI